MSNKLLIASLLAGTTLLGASTVHAADYPEKPVRIIELPEVRARWAQLGADPITNTPAQFASWLDGESLKWGKVVKESGAKPD